MRVLLVGSPDACARLRAELDGSTEVAGEFTSLAAARASEFEVDALVVAPDGEHGLAQDLVEPLTPREVQVLERLAEGLPNKAIAAALGISDQTVKFHVSSISGKLGTANRTDAVRRAARRGLITL